MHGFYNNGNTCYFNAAIQCMLRIHELSDHILRNPYTGECTFTSAYAELVRVYFQSEKCLSINLEPLIEKFRDKFPRFKSRLPHDTQDTIFCIIDILEVSYPYIKELVYGENEQYTICPSGSKSEKVPFTILLLHSEDGKSVGDLVRTSEKWATLTDYVDDAGIKHHVTTTRTSIVKFPKILFVSFDKKIRIIADEIFEKYELCGSIIHKGDNHGGHYMSMIKLGDKWYSQDDETLSVVDFPKLHDHHVLMYNLKNPPS